MNYKIVALVALWSISSLKACEAETKQEMSKELTDFIDQWGISSAEYANYKKITPLMEAVIANNLNKVRELILLGSNLNAQDNHGLTALHHAINIDNPVLAHELIVSGADVNIQNNDGNSPLHRAIGIGMPETIKLLLNYKADPNAINTLTKSPLELTITSVGFKNNADRLEIVKALLDRNANIDSQNEDGITPLMFAIMKKNAPLVAKLLLYNPDLTLTTKLYTELKDLNINTQDEQLSARDLAQKVGNLEIIKLLDDHQRKLREARKQAITQELNQLPKGVASIIDSYLE